MRVRPVKRAAGEGKVKKRRDVKGRVGNGSGDSSRFVPLTQSLAVLLVPALAASRARLASPRVNGRETRSVFTAEESTPAYTPGERGLEPARAARVLSSEMAPGKSSLGGVVRARSRPVPPASASVARR